MTYDRAKYWSKLWTDVLNVVDKEPKPIKLHNISSALYEEYAQNDTQSGVWYLIGKGILQLDEDFMVSRAKEDMNTVLPYQQAHIVKRAIEKAIEIEEARRRLSNLLDGSLSRIGTSDYFSTLVQAERIMDYYIENAEDMGS